MAITRMTTGVFPLPPNVVEVSDYWGYEKGRINHYKECPHYADHFNGIEISPNQTKLYPECISWQDENGQYRREYCSGPFKSLFMETTHQGLVLELGEYNGYDDSDFYAVVWNWEKNSTERIIYASTRGWTYPNSASVDATPEVIAAYQAYCEKRRAEYEEMKRQEELKRPSVGKTVRVVRGRKVPKGTTGKVVWYGEDRYHRGKMRVGMMVDGKRVFVDAEYCEVIY